MRKLDRREFLTVAAGTAAGLAGTGLNQERREIFDLVISGGHLVDPAAGMNAALDIGIAGGRVVQIAEHILPSEGRRVIDATGRIVTPGLIDVHVHVFDGVAQVGI